MQTKIRLLFLFFIILFSANLNADPILSNGLPSRLDSSSLARQVKIEGEKVDYLMKEGLVVAI
ncbi:MAG: hypothetical protein PHW62_05965, partial [Candidatus Ratteibacteria bacterium]|nr:hypothetical protein [Candidatus Ratteibacteria bacterium]